MERINAIRGHRDLAIRPRIVRSKPQRGPTIEKYLGMVGAAAFMRGKECFSAL
jgi:hypothetical protein